MYSEDELLPISSLQHLAFCERQWALIHLEQQWQENVLTSEGALLHEHVHDAGAASRRTLVVARSLPLRSFRLGLSGQSDAVELRSAADGDPLGVEIPGRIGRWMLYPVEYKRGSPKRHNCDRVQLCAQAFCLEEMLGAHIPEGALFYASIRRRQAVPIDSRLRSETETLCARLHELYRAGRTPAPVYSKGCESCSLKEICSPKAIAAKPPVWKYLSSALSE